MKLTRLLRHRWLDEDDARRALGSEALARIEARVRASEAHHSGEIRVCVEAGLPLSYLWRDATPRERAVTLFGKLRVWDTENNNGVLIYLLLAEHAIEIVVDRGLDRQAGTAQWQAIVAEMSAAFREGRFEEGLNAAIDHADALLCRHFSQPASAANPNELPDAPVLR
ncbi:MAG: TPM domain-containing protein [Methylibium sp.]|uniref:TPM domain-containing protein n=1 Tax=Methylibium sp. TaxID=2067992 RepID=UPI0017D10DFF|nr:TPM domain-containing protein [Methylibium sp.]MBA3599575.1 TPM domain-containing protein [Methylibium sp.]